MRLSKIKQWQPFFLKSLRFSWVCLATLLLVLMPFFLPSYIHAAPRSSKALSPLSVPQWHAALRAYLLAHPDVVVASLHQIDVRKQAHFNALMHEAIDVHAQALFNDPASPTWGDPHATTLVVVFDDANCPNCRAIVQKMPALLKAYPRMRWIEKPLPMYGASAHLAARALLAAFRVSPEHALLFYQNLMSGTALLTSALVFQKARQAGFDVAVLRKVMAEAWVTQALKRMKAQASELGVDAVPTVIVAEPASHRYLVHVGAWHLKAFLPRWLGTMPHSQHKAS